MVELSVNQILKEAVQAHNSGNIAEAERLYKAVLTAQPQNPDADHNLGVLAISAGKTESSLPLFQTALKSKPSEVQFWFSYINALIKAEKLRDASFNPLAILMGLSQRYVMPIDAPL